MGGVSSFWFGCGQPEFGFIIRTELFKPVENIPTGTARKTLKNLFCRIDHERPFSVVMERAQTDIFGAFMGELDALGNDVDDIVLLFEVVKVGHNSPAI